MRERSLRGDGDAAHRLGRLANARGIVVGLALDHRDTLREAAVRRGVALEHAELAQFKEDVVRALAPLASAVMLDAEIGRKALAAVPAPVALVMPLEAQGYDTVDSGRVGRLMADFTPEVALSLGAHACKLFVFYRADHVPSARRQEDLVRRVAAACRLTGLPLVLEPTVYRLPEESEAEYEARFGALVADGASQLRSFGPDLLKLQFPGRGGSAESDQALCRDLDEACDDTPWVLLGGGEVEGELLLRHVEIACRAGASGFLLGRGVWGSALVRGRRERSIALSRAASLFARCAEIASALAAPLAARASRRKGSMKGASA